MSGNYVGKGPDAFSALIGAPNGVAGLDAAAKLVKSQFPLAKMVTFTRDMTLASGNQAVVGIGFKPRIVYLFATTGTGPPSAAASSSEASIGVAADGGPIANLVAACAQNVGVGLWNVTALCVFLIQSAALMFQGAVISFDADGFTMQWTKVGAKTGVVNVSALALP